MMGIRLILVTILIGGLLIAAESTLAQSSDPSSAELWTDVGFRLKLPKKVDVTFTHQVRFDENMSRRYLVAPELTIGYALVNWWQLEGGYRYDYERDNDAVFQDRYRIFASTRFMTKFRPVTLDLRIQWQKKFRQEQDDGTPTRHILRTRFRAKLRQVPTVNPYASVEMFHRLDGLDKDIPAGTIQKYRLGLGVEWQHGPVEFNVRYYHVLPDHDPQEASRHILSLGVRLDWAPWRRGN